MKIREIAKALNLSISTVSKAINNATDVSEETRKNVLEYLIQHGENLKKKHSHAKKICIILEDIKPDEKHMAYEILESFQKAANIYDYEVVIKSTQSTNCTFDYTNLLIENNFLGAFIIGINLESPMRQQLELSDLPTVVLDNAFQKKNISSINVDNINSICKMVDLLCSKGHKKIAFLCGEKHSQVSRERLGGYIAGLLNNDMKFNGEMIFFGNYKQNCCEKFIEKIIHLQPDAVICASDLIAIGLIKKLKENNIKVPQDISVTGVDNIILSEYCKPPLTTIDYDLRHIGHNAFAMLRQLIKGSGSYRITIYGSLVERDSVLDRRNPI